MSGTYQLDGELFPVNPIGKRWRRDKIADSGVAESIYTDFWSLELSFPTLATAAEASWFYDRWTAGGLHNAVLPHPRTGQLVGFTGVDIVDWAFEFDDVDRDGWATGPRMMLGHISMSATGSI